MQAKQMMLGLLGSAILGGGVAVGGYKLLEPKPPMRPRPWLPTPRCAIPLRCAAAPTPCPKA